MEKKKINQLQKQIEELKAGWQRTQADFENYRKRTETEKADWRAASQTDLILQILPVLDNFRRATDHVPADQKNSDWVIGIQHIERQLEDVLKNNGLEKIETKPGDKFDPQLHEAVEGADGGNIISTVVLDGYRLGEQVIRPTKVKVGRDKDKS